MLCLRARVCHAWACLRSQSCMRTRTHPLSLLSLERCPSSHPLALLAVPQTHARTLKCAATLSRYVLASMHACMLRCTSTAASSSSLAVRVCICALFLSCSMCNVHVYATSIYTMTMTTHTRTRSRCTSNCAHPFVSQIHEMTWLSVAVPAPQAPPSVRIALRVRTRVQVRRECA